MLDVQCPGLWGVVARADEHMRSEEWAAVHRAQVAMGCPPSMWSPVIRTSAYGTDFDNSRQQWWFTHVLKPALSHPRDSARAEAEVDAIEGVDSQAGYVELHGRQAGDRRKAPARKQQPPPKKPRQDEKGAGKGDKGNDKADDDICRKFNAKGGGNSGCKTPCRFGRKHICLGCGGDHAYRGDGRHCKK